MLAGAGEISYRPFVTLDVIGSIVYASLCIVLGATVGALALERVGGAARAVLFLGARGAFVHSRVSPHRSLAVWRRVARFDQIHRVISISSKNFPRLLFRSSTESRRKYRELLPSGGRARPMAHAMQTLCVKEVTTMKAFQRFVGAGLAAGFTLLALAEVAWPQVTRPPVPPTEGVAGYGFIAFLCVMGLLVAVGIAVKLYDVKRKREDEGIALQSRLSDALLSDPALAGLPVTPTVHVPFSRRTPVVVTITGAVSSPSRRETVLEVIARVATPLETNYRIEDRLIVDPRMTRRAA